MGIHVTEAQTDRQPASQPILEASVGATQTPACILATNFGCHRTAVCSNRFGENFVNICVSACAWRI
jgi:hypothetical protein